MCSQKLFNLVINQNLFFCSKAFIIKTEEMSQEECIWNFDVNQLTLWKVNIPEIKKWEINPDTLVERRFWYYWRAFCHRPITNHIYIIMQLILPVIIGKHLPIFYLSNKICVISHLIFFCSIRQKGSKRVGLRRRK